jgi:hypothetical protein
MVIWGFEIRGVVVNKNIALITIALLLLMLLSGCAGDVSSGNADVSPNISTQANTTEIEPTETPSEADVSPDISAQTDAVERESAETSLEEPQEPDFSCDESFCTPWQMAYLTLLRDIISRETTERIAEIEGSADTSIQLSDSYCLYDIDKDEIPEIFIKFGCCEADYRTEVYTFKNESVAFVGDFGSGHSCLYTWPGENAILLHWGHMGYASMYQISIVNGTLVVGDEIFSEDLSESEADYTDPSEIVPGSVYIPYFWTMLNREDTIPWMLNNESPPSPSLFIPLTLPIYDYYPATSPGNSVAYGNMREAAEKVMSGQRKIYGVSGDGFGGDTGWIYFDDYCQPGTVDRYAKQPMQVRKSGWVDFNQDGREEYILYLGESEKTAISSDIYVILSGQDDVVYAYCLNYDCNDEVYQDGMFAGEYALPFGISFYKNQCYTYEKAHDPNTPAIAWQYN